MKTQLVATWALVVATVALAPTAGGSEPPIPESLREGWGFADDIEALGRTLDGGYELSKRDVDCDGQPEVLLEWLALRGATGNRGYLLFDHRPNGYLYRGQVDRIWSVLDFRPDGGCYLATYSKAGAGRMTMRLLPTSDSDLEPVGSLELLVGDAGVDEDNALLAALSTGRLAEERLRRLFAMRGPRPGDPEQPTTFPWVERSSVAAVAAEVEGYGPHDFERVTPAEVAATAPESPWWGRVSPRVARHWAAAVEEAVVRGEVEIDRPLWLPPAGHEGLRVTASRVDHAVRLTRGVNRPPAGVAIGRFEAELGWPDAAAPRRIEVTWAAIVATTRLGEPEEILRVFLGTASDDESRRIFRLERVTNFDHDPEQEVVIDEEAYAGRLQWVVDLSPREGVETRRLHSDAWD